MRDLGLQLTLNDAGADVSIRDNVAMIEETARLMNIKCEIIEHEGNFVALFERK